MKRKKLQNGLKGKIISGFELLEKIAEGGMGAIYKARQISLDRVVVLKLIRKTLLDEESYASRLVREAKYIAKLVHPNIVQVYDVGEAEGLYYIAMEYVPGDNVEEILRREGRLPIARATDIIRLVLETLEYTHVKGIIHRDLKPANILITEEGDVKLADFGLARFAGDDSTITKEGLIAGTPAYMSPEQCRGEKVEAASDIYSAGVAFYQMLCGKRPFESNSPLELVSKHCNEPVPPLRSVNPEIPTELEKVVHKMLEKDRKKRYQSAAEVLKDLQNDEIAEFLKDERKKLAETTTAVVREKAPAKKPTDSEVAEILRKRMELDEVLEKKYMKNITVMFTDMKGSTGVYDSQGDIGGRQMIQAHNDMLVPIIKRKSGEIIKTIGDAIMASFENADDAVSAAIEMQNALQAHNIMKPDPKRIHIRIGINSGRGIVEDHDVFGHLVNLASRIESLAQQDQIYISKDTFREISSNPRYLCRFVKLAKMRGIKDEAEVFEVIWRGLEEKEDKRKPAPFRLREKTFADTSKGFFILKMARVGDEMHIETRERSEEKSRFAGFTEKTPVNWEEVDNLCLKMFALSRGADKASPMESKTFQELLCVSNNLYYKLFSTRILEVLDVYEGSELLLEIDEKLIHIPWELLFDGEQFLCMRFNIGKTVAGMPAEGVKQPEVPGKIKMLILCDPRGDLPGTVDECRSIEQEVIRAGGKISPVLRNGPFGVEYVKRELPQYDIVHYAGHAEYSCDDPQNSSWLLDKGRLTRSDIVEMANSGKMPYIIFSNACKSGLSETSDVHRSSSFIVYGLANVFLTSWAKHYIGTLWDVEDQISKSASITFYKELVAGSCIGRALRMARLEAIRKHGYENLHWASYVLYGSPDFALIKKPASKTIAKPDALAKRKALNPALVVSWLVAAALIIFLGFAFLRPFLNRPSGPPDVPVLAPGSPPRINIYGEDNITNVFNREIVIDGYIEGAAKIKNLKIKNLSVGDFPIPIKAGYFIPFSRKVPLVPGENRIAISALDGENKQARTELVVNYEPLKPVEGGIKLSAAVLPFTGATEKSRRLANDCYGLLTEELLHSKRFTMLSREAIDEILKEHKISRSDLADEMTVLSVGNLKIADTMITGNVTSDNGTSMLYVNVVDVQSSTYVASEKGSFAADDRNQMQKCVGDIAIKLLSAFAPVSVGEIKDIVNDKYYCNLGKAHGMKEGTKFFIFRSTEDVVAGEKVETKEPVAKGEIVRVVNDNTSRCEIDSYFEDDLKIQKKDMLITR